MSEVLIKHSSEIFWREISKNQKLSESFIEKFENKVDWRRISSHQVIPLKGEV